MNPADYDYELPPELIAHYPADRRSDSRLLCLERRSGAVSHTRFSCLPELLSSRDLLVFNDTRVIAARLFGRKDTGGRLEMLIERLEGPAEVLARIRVSNPPVPGTRIRFEPRRDAAGVMPELEADVLGREGPFYRLRFATDGRSLETVLESYGHTPLPPYIRREAEGRDRERYQTVYARRAGAVAAPTAGLHFDEPLLERLRQLGVETASLTLHVGSGTFQPVRVDDLREHRMHSEQIEVDETVCQRIRACRQRGGRVVAVGTTCVRSLETAAREAGNGESLIGPYQGETDIFIYPGFEFRVVDAMITNFHLPRSTLMMLVSAFAGRESVLAAYSEAVRERYRFFSYGDAMLIR